MYSYKIKTFFQIRYSRNKKSDFIYFQNRNKDTDISTYVCKKILPIKITMYVEINTLLVITSSNINIGTLFYYVGQPNYYTFFKIYTIILQVI